MQLAESRRHHAPQVSPARSRAGRLLQRRPSRRREPVPRGPGGPGKEDTAYLNPDGIEVEVDLEGDVDGARPTSSRRARHARPVRADLLAQAARRCTSSRSPRTASDADRAEWQVDGTWNTAAEVPDAARQLKHWRLRGLNAVLLYDARERRDRRHRRSPPRCPLQAVQRSSTDARQDLRRRRRPHRPRPVASTGTSGSPRRRLQGRAAGPEGHRLARCSRPASSTLPRVRPARRRRARSPSVVLFGQIGDGAITESDPGMRNFKRMASWLDRGRVHTRSPAPLGHRFEKKLVDGVTFEIDLYSPTRVLGPRRLRATSPTSRRRSASTRSSRTTATRCSARSDFWARPKYPSFYQIFLYGGCLGYEYYVKPHPRRQGRHWAKLDILSSVVEVSADANEFAGPGAREAHLRPRHGYSVSWRDLLLTRAQAASATRPSASRASATTASRRPARAATRDSRSPCPLLCARASPRFDKGKFVQFQVPRASSLNPRAR